ncbi:MAG: hypothetical protein IPJ06_06795 [Saprospiraceae bacterium]|nr:hypothetical protein [Saprospiraceae bacterium]
MKRYAMHLCILSFLFLFGVTASHAQDDQSESIVSQMKEATKEFESEVKSLKSKLESGEINQEAFGEAMEEAADQFEEKWNPG